MRRCLDVHGRRYGPTWAAYDGKLPPVPNWPRNPVAPSRFNVSQLLREKRVLEAEVARIGRHSRPTSLGNSAKSNNGTTAATRALEAALGKLASTSSALAVEQRLNAFGLSLTL